MITIVNQKLQYTQLVSVSQLNKDTHQPSATSSSTQITQTEEESHDDI